MIYYPLSTLMLAGIREILVITTPHEQEQFKRLLQDGSQWGIGIQYATQEKPEGLAQALIIGEEFIDGSPVALILGDNIFYGPGMGTALSRMSGRPGATVFAYKVADPERYGVVEFDSSGKVLSIEEKPSSPKSNYAIPGLYFYDGQAPAIAKRLQPSIRGELEITDLHREYLAAEKLNVEILDSDKTWLDTGTIESLHLAAEGVRKIEEGIGRKINVPEEVAWRLGLIDSERLKAEAEKYGKSGYGEYLRSLLAYEFGQNNWRRLGPALAPITNRLNAKS
jgi:glucose-1-phosphate thymidylyltransferase